MKIEKMIAKKTKIDAFVVKSNGKMQRYNQFLASIGEKQFAYIQSSSNTKTSSAFIIYPTSPAIEKPREMQQQCSIIQFEANCLVAVHLSYLTLIEESKCVES